MKKTMQFHHLPSDNKLHEGISCTAAVDNSNNNSPATCMCNLITQRGATCDFCKQWPTQCRAQQAS